MYHSEQGLATASAPGTPDLRSEYHSHGWSVDGQDKSGRMALMVDGHVHALTMPAQLGERVQRILSIHMLAGPVLSYPAQRRWVFLTEPEPLPDRLPDDVATEDVTTARPGTRLRIPAGRDGSAEVRWVACPESGRQAPPWRAVVSATRRALSEAVLERSA
jgi:hypothetical protein